jgi:EAL domain-containing protein (putative c-di-GMP-specific phosphodiesterase class I)
LRSPDLVEHVAGVIRDTEIRPTSLTLELTESVAMGGPTGSRHQLAALRQLGVDIAIDDFGTGHSSLSYLGQFCLTCLKIDRSFIQQLDEGYGETLVRAVLSLGANLGLRVIAEGVETPREGAHLQRLGCLYAQGFHFYQPLKPEAVESVLKLATSLPPSPGS